MEVLREKSKRKECNVGRRKYLRHRIVKEEELLPAPAELPTLIDLREQERYLTKILTNEPTSNEELRLVNQQLEQLKLRIAQGANI